MITAGEKITFSYDGCGRRTAETSTAGPSRQYTWTAQGDLASIVEQNSDMLIRADLHVDALGQLAAVNDEKVFWDATDRFAAPVQVGDTAITQIGALTAHGDHWLPVSWRQTRNTSPGQPWDSDTGAAGEGIGLSPGGGLHVAGLEWMQARSYDQRTRSFLSSDPVEHVPGAGWAGNTYAYAGNNPINAIDPTGMRPLTDADFVTYMNNHQGVVSWTKNNWEYVVAGAAIVAGIALMFTGIGGPVGVVLIGAASGALISGGVSIATQKATTGKVDWDQVGTQAMIGAAGGAAGAGLGLLGQGATLIGKIGIGAATGAATGALESGLQYLASDQPLTPAGFSQAITQGAITGAIGGATGGATTHGLQKVQNKCLGDMSSGLTQVKDELVNQIPASDTITKTQILEDYLFRGVARSHPGYPDFLNGIARPRGGLATPYEHNLGNTESEFTSWTTDIAVAERFADGGTILKISREEVVDRIVDSPDYYNESEILIRGTVTGA